MLAKPNRLARRRDFDALFKKGRRASDAFLTLAYARTEVTSPFRMAFIVSAKTEKSAVKRNRARRQAREIVKAVLPSLPKGVDAALTIKRPFLKLDFAQKREAVLRLLKRAKLV